mmetsp:Transcript_17179/g.39215  ORF Transcript_17179/g.39215 Transcript_17179/m.39215 type:complete len:363 (-) Transcript_17179:229-1317(-)
MPSQLDASTSASALPSLVKFVDIGANLLDDRYTDGIYFGKKRHEPDFDLVLERAIEEGVTHVILTAGTLAESRKALNVVQEYRSKPEDNEKAATPLFLGCTVGVHPTRCQQEFVDNPSETGTTAGAILDELATLLARGLENGCVVAIGEIGLDYDRLEFASRDVQVEFFRRQLDRFLYAEDENLGALPLFLHNRSVGRDVLEILKEHKDRVNPHTREKVPIRGVVHSFDDSLELAREFIDLGLYIGLNGCSLKTAENLEVVVELPLESILLETDCPYCEIKATHAGHKYIQTTFAGRKKPDKKFEAGKMVKGRNEPCQIVQVAEVIAGVKGIPVEEVAEACYQNSMNLYGRFFEAKPKTIIS